jgi:hypothetical protein
MPRESDSTPNDAPTCRRHDCDTSADFWLYHPDGWRPLCERHTLDLHPSIEVNAWLESGYARPAELDRPEGPPPAPPTARGRAFREIVEEAMGWSE